MSTQHDIDKLRFHLQSLFLCCQSIMATAVNALVNSYRFGLPLEITGKQNSGYDGFIGIAHRLGIKPIELSAPFTNDTQGYDWLNDNSTKNQRAWIPPASLREGDMHVMLPFYLKYHLQELRKRDSSFPVPTVESLYVLSIWNDCFGKRLTPISTRVFKDMLAWEPLGRKLYKSGLTLPYDKASSIIDTLIKLPDVAQQYIGFCKFSDGRDLTIDPIAERHPYTAQIRSRTYASGLVGSSYSSNAVSYSQLIRILTYEIDQVTVITKNLWTLYYLGLTKQVKDPDEVRRCLKNRLKGLSEDEISKEMLFESRSAYDKWLIAHCIDVLPGSVTNPHSDWLKACDYFGIEPNAGFFEDPELVKKMFISALGDAQAEERTSAISETPAKPPFILPDRTTWEDITIEIVGLDAAKILVGDRIFAASAFEMGFEDQRKRQPNQLWALLVDFAEAQGTLNWTTQQRSKNWDTKDFQRLRNSLKAFFNLPDDPLLPYNPKVGYQTRFKILYDRTSNP